MTTLLFSIYSSDFYRGPTPTSAARRPNAKSMEVDEVDPKTQAYDEWITPRYIGENTYTQELSVTYFVTAMLLSFPKTTPGIGSFPWRARGPLLCRTLLAVIQMTKSGTTQLRAVYCLLSAPLIPACKILRGNVFHEKHTLTGKVVSQPSALDAVFPALVTDRDMPMCRQSE